MDGTGISADELSGFSTWFLEHGIPIIIILVIAIIGYRFFYLIARRMAERIQALDDIDGSARDKRIETIFRAITNAGLIIVVTAASLTILQELNVEIAPLLASVGIAGLALGLGAQTLVEDVISGLFILVENQFRVGDIVEINDYSGEVEALNLRTTSIRSLDGSLHIIPNGEIRVVSNKSSGWSRAVLDVGIPYEDDVEKAVATLEEIGRQGVNDDQIGELLLEEPIVTGIEGLEDWQIRVRLLVKTSPGAQFKVERYFRHQIQAKFPARGLALASPRQEIVVISET